MQSVGGTRFPWGTLAVNVAGSLVLGFLLGASLARTGAAPAARAFWGIGILGAFTTFSTFSYETVALLQVGDWKAAAANVALNVGLGLAAVVLGLRLGG